MLLCILSLPCNPMSWSCWLGKAHCLQAPNVPADCCTAPLWCFLLFMLTAYVPTAVCLVLCQLLLAIPAKLSAGKPFMMCALLSCFLLLHDYILVPSYCFTAQCCEAVCCIAYVSKACCFDAYCCGAQCCNATQWSTVLMRKGSTAPW